MLCSYAFPQCVIKNGLPLKLPLCYEDCVAIHLQFCYNDWVLIEENKSKNKFIKSRGHFRLPDCNQLPKYDKSLKQPKCSYVGLTELKKELVTKDCRIGNGRYYLGIANTTNTGLACQKWSMQSPQEHIRPPEVFPELKNAENYCRNVGGEEEQPWCYTMSPTVRWQHCNVPLCRKCFSISKA